MTAYHFPQLSMDGERLTFPGGEFDELVLKECSIHIERLDDDVLYIDVRGFRGYLGGTLYAKRRWFRAPLICFNITERGGIFKEQK